MLGLLANGQPLTSRQIIDALRTTRSDRDVSDIHNIVRTIDCLNQKGLIRIGCIVLNQKGIDVEVYLTFAKDWVLKL